MRISDWSSDVCSSDLHRHVRPHDQPGPRLCTASVQPPGGGAAAARARAGPPEGAPQKGLNSPLTVSRPREMVPLPANAGVAAPAARPIMPAKNNKIGRAHV